MAAGKQLRYGGSGHARLSYLPKYRQAIRDGIIVVFFRWGVVGEDTSVEPQTASWAVAGSIPGGGGFISWS